MPEKYLYEYSVIRILPVVEREEFINVGIILVCKQEGFIKVLYQLDEVKIHAFCKDLDIEQIKLNLESFEKIAIGDTINGSITSLDIASRFRWLTAVRSSAIQTTRPHPGISNNLEKTATRLFKELVL